MTTALTKPPEWHERRRQGIGGSDAGAVCGVDEYKTAYELYLEKTGELEPKVVSNAAVKFGTLLEGIVADEAALALDAQIVSAHNFYRHPEYPWLQAEVDRVMQWSGMPDNQFLLECKTSGKPQDWGPNGSMDEGRFPIKYEIQIHHQFAASGFDYGYLAVLIQGRDFRLYRVDRDEELVNLIITKEKAFWECVTNRTPPAIDYAHETTAELMARLYPGTNGLSIDLPNEALDSHAIIEECQEKIRELEKIKQCEKNKLKELMGEYAIGKLPDGTAYTRAIRKRKSYTVEPKEYVDFRFTKKAKE